MDTQDKAADSYLGHPKGNRLAMLAADAELVLDFLNEIDALREDPRGNIRSALQHAAIVVYARSFTKNFGNEHEVEGRAHLSWLPVGSDDSLRALHDEVMQRRNTLVAHSDWEFRRSVVVSSPAKPAPDGLPGVLRWTTAKRGTENIDWRMFRALVERVGAEARDAAFDLEARTNA